MNKLEQQTMVDEIKKKERNIVAEIESKSKDREEAIMRKTERMSDVEDALFHELKQNKEILLKFELAAVTLAGVSIFLIACLYLRCYYKYSNFETENE